MEKVRTLTNSIHMQTLHSVSVRYRNRLREQRMKRLIYTGKQLAEMAGFSPVVVNVWENNKRMLPIEAALRFCEILGCTLDDLYESTIGKQPGQALQPDDQQPPIQAAAGTLQ